MNSILEVTKDFNDQLTLLLPLLHAHRLGNFPASSESDLNRNLKDYFQVPRCFTYILSFYFHCNSELDLARIIISTFRIGNRDLETLNNKTRLCTELELKPPKSL